MTSLCASDDAACASVTGTVTQAAAAVGSRDVSSADVARSTCNVLTVAGAVVHCACCRRICCALLLTHTEGPAPFRHNRLLNCFSQLDRSRNFRCEVNHSVTSQWDTLYSTHTQNDFKLCSFNFLSITYYHPMFVMDEAGNGAAPETPWPRSPAAADRATGAARTQSQTGRIHSNVGPVVG